MSGVVTRSQSQGDKDETTMAEDKESVNRGNASKASLKSPLNLNQDSEDDYSDHYNGEKDKTVKVKKGDKTTKQKQLDAVNRDKVSNKTLAQTQSHDIHKGYVAERVDKINSNPSTPVTSAKMPKIKTSNTRPLVSQNGQLGIQGVQSFANSLAQKLHEVPAQHVEDDEGASLTTILRELAGTVKKLEHQLDKMETERKATENKVSVVETVQQQEVIRLRGAIDQIDDHDDKLKALIGIVVKQDQQIQALTNQVNAAYAAKCNKNLIINGIPEMQGENGFHEVAHFFKFVLKLKDKVPLKYVRRLGKGKEKPLLIRVQNFNDKNLVFQNLEKLKEANKSRQRPYFITDQLPEAWAERKRFIHFMKQQNKKLPVAQQLKASVKNNVLCFDEEEYTPPIKPPTVSQFLNLSPERKKVIRQLDIIQGKQETEQESIFISYSAQVFSVQQVQDYYYHVKLLNPEATHIMCAFKLPGVDFTKVQGAVDDGEYAGGRSLLRILIGEQHINRAVFVVRYYGGKHIGPQRFAIIERVAKIALQKLVDHEKAMKQPPTQQELDDYMAQQAALQHHQPPSRWEESTDEDEHNDDTSQHEEDSQYSNDGSE